MICTKPPNLVSRGHGVDIVPIFIEHGPPEFPCPTQNKQLNEIIHLDLSGPDNMCPYFTDLALFPACKPQNTYNPTTEKKQPKVECRTSIAFDRRRSNGRYEPAHAFCMTPWRLTHSRQRKHRHNPAKIAPLFTTTDTNRIFVLALPRIVGAQCPIWKRCRRRKDPS